MLRRHNVLTRPDDEEVRVICNVYFGYVSHHHCHHQVAGSDEFTTNKTAMIVYRAAVAAIPGVPLSYRESSCVTDNTYMKYTAQDES